MSKPAIGKAIGALTLIEQALYLLRRGQSGALAAYYTGTLPFVLALLYFWSDMSRNASAASYCSPAAAGVALLFIWMKLWQVRCCRCLWCALQGKPQETWPWLRLFSTTCRQAVLQATGIVVLPIAVIVAVPLAWVFAYYQNLTVLDDPETRHLRELSQVAKHQALLWPVQNHILLSLLPLFGLLVFLNWFRGLAALPYLLKYLLGVETVFTLSGMHLLNTTYLAVLGVLTYLCVDPIIKAVYVLRCYHGVSRHSGDDLRTELKPFLRGAALVLLIVGAVMTSQAVAARQEGNMPKDLWQSVSDPQGYVTQLDRAIKITLQQRHFAWRLPKEALPVSDAQQGWLMQSLHWLGDMVGSMLRTVGGWISAVFDWLMEKLASDANLSESGGDGSWRWTLRIIFYALGGGLTLMLVYFLVRTLLRHRPSPELAPETAPLSGIDISDETVTAQDLPLDGWLAMARELMASQDYQKALRALYLSVLAVLADQHRVVIARYKSNFDYAGELARRAHAEPELLAAFGWCVLAFERAWYGTHPVTRDHVEAFMGRQERITAIVQTAA
jgi:hypothetical protein